MAKILVTGGLGFIGSHTVVELISAGYEPVIIDNLSESDIEVKARIEKIVDRQVIFEQVEMCNKEELDSCFQRHPEITGVIHFAAFLLVDESVRDPIKYYHNNLLSTIHLLQCMKTYSVRPLVFSSSCTVYGNPDELPVSEDAPIKPAISPYGNTKKICEDILRDTARAEALNMISLRYFNPIGAHESALIGEFQSGPPHHLVPYITETASGLRDELKIFGKDWNTPDGTCIRDYIHVVDVAKAHISAIARLLNGKQEEDFEVFNLGTGIGYSVLDMVKAFEEATGIAIKHRFTDRRPGDVEAVFGDTSKANRVLGWTAEKSLADAMRDAWRWEKKIRSS